MEPESTSVALRRDLSAVAQEFDAERARMMFIGLAVAPIFPVLEAAAEFPVMNRENFKKPADTDRATGGAYNRLTGKFGKGTYTCEEHGLEYAIDDRKRKLYATFLNAEEAAVRILRYQILLAHERRVAAISLNNTNFTANAPAAVWSDTTNGKPLDDLVTGCETLEDNTGVPRSEFSLILPRADQREMMATAQVVDKVKYTYPGVQPAMLQAGQIAAMLGIREVHICRGGYDSAEEGVAESAAQIWTAGAVMLALLGREGDPLETPALARTMLWTADSPELPVIETYREDKVRSDIVRMRDDTDEILIGELDLFGYRLTT